MWDLETQGIDSDPDSDPFYTLPNTRYNTDTAKLSSSHNYSLPRFQHERALDSMVGTSKVTDWGEQQSRSSVSLWTSSTQASTSYSVSIRTTADSRYCVGRCSSRCC